MRTAQRKDVLTTGEVARICHVAPRTVSKWFDSGELKGYRIPGSRDRRIPAEGLAAFMRAHGMPLDGLDGEVCRVLIIGEDVSPELLAACSGSGRYEVRTAGSGFEAGLLARQFRPHAVVMDADDDEASEICRNIKAGASVEAAKVIAAARDLTDSLRRRLLGQGFDGVLPSPYSFPELAGAVESTANPQR